MVDKIALNRMFSGLALLLACSCFLVGDALSQEVNIEKSFPNVVMIDARIDGQSGFGAGVVVGTRAGRIYIATANHVVRSGRLEATDIQVRFHFLPGERFEASLLEHRDKDLDIAIISVVGKIPENEFKFRILGKSSGLKRGSDVHPLGNPGANAWGVALRPEKVDSRSATIIKFQSSYIQGGHSGGALLDGCGDIVGMIVRDNAPNGEAVRIESVLEFLRQSNYPVNLEETGGCASTPAPKTSRTTGTAAASDARVVDNNGDAPEVLSAGSSRKFRITQAQSIGTFIFTPAATGAYNISAVSEPSSVDLGWLMYTDADEDGITCDNDEPVRGIEACSVYLTGGRPQYLMVQNLTGDQPGEPAQAVDFTITISADTDSQTGTLSDSDTGTINIRYTGDQGGCTVLVGITLENNDRYIEPPGNFFSVPNLELGMENYAITGQIGCAIWGGTCVVSGQGVLDIQDGRTYDIVWQDLQNGFCAMVLQ